MRVLILTTSYKGEYAGNCVHNLAENLVKMGCQVRVLLPHGKETQSYETVDGVKMYRFQYMWPKRFQNVAYGSGIGESIGRLTTLGQLPLFFFAYTLQAIRHAVWADVLHCQWALSGLPGLIAARLLGKPVLVTFHGAEVYTGRFRRIVKFIGENANVLVFNSSFTRDRALEFVKPMSYEVIHPASIDVSSISPSYAQKDGVLILSLGRLVERKGFEYLIRAFASMKNGLDARLVIGGEGPLRGRLERLSADLGVSDRVQLVGRIPDDMMEGLFRSCDIFVLPAIVDSRGDTEGFGLVLLEAQAWGKPVVATRVGGIVDIVKDGMNGFLVRQKDVLELAKKIDALVEDPALRTRMGMRGRQIVCERFDSAKLTKKTLGLYRSLI
jgi:glycosyltransferase involved in cell wall biosynthesis